MARLDPSGLSDIADAEHLYARTTELLADDSRRGPLGVDLSQVDFVSPVGIVALVTTARLWHRETGHSVRIHSMQPKVHGYLERVDLFHQCAGWIAEDKKLDATERFDRLPASPTLLELLPIAGGLEQNARDVAAAVTGARRILATWFPANDSAVDRLLTMLAEIASNIIHSRDRGFAVVQRYKVSDPNQLGSRVAIAVADLGIGIEASLRSRDAELWTRDKATPITGSDYIWKALQLGVTSRGEFGGIGLHQVRSLVLDWQGTLTIRSGASFVRVSPSGSTVGDGLAAVPGVQVAISVQGPLEAR